MNNTMQVGDWCFEIVQIRARKCNKYSDEFTGTLMITITDGEPHLEGLLVKDGFTMSDRQDISKFLFDLGFKDVYSSKFIGGERRKVKRKTGDKYDRS